MLHAPGRVRRSGGLLPSSFGGLDSLLPLLIRQEFAVGQLAEVLLDKGKLRVGRTPNKSARLLDNALVVLADDVGRVSLPERVGHFLLMRGDEQDTRRNRQGDVGPRIG